MHVDDHTHTILNAGTNTQAHTSQTLPNTIIYTLTHLHTLSDTIIYGQAQLQIHTHTHTHTHTYTHTHKHAHMDLCVTSLQISALHLKNKCTQTPKHTGPCVKFFQVPVTLLKHKCMQTHTHTRTHTHTHRPLCRVSSNSSTSPPTCPSPSCQKMEQPTSH